MTELQNDENRTSLAPTNGQYAGSKPEVLNTTGEQQITCSISSVLH